jgi:hypothetical protein
VCESGWPAIRSVRMLWVVQCWTYFLTAGTFVNNKFHKMWLNLHLCIYLVNNNLSHWGIINLCGCRSSSVECKCWLMVRVFQFALITRLVKLWTVVTWRSRKLENWGIRKGIEHGAWSMEKYSWQKLEVRDQTSEVSRLRLMASARQGGLTAYPLPFTVY